MRRSKILALTFFVLCAVFLMQSKVSPHAMQATTVYAAQTPPASACQFPNQPASSPEQTAWQIFVAATCPTGSGSQYPYIAWETWPEQQQVYPPGGLAAAAKPEAAPTEHHFFKSELAAIVAARKRGAKLALPLTPNEGCNSQTTSGRTICEEVRINPIMANWIWAGNLQTRPGQANAAANYVDIEMPPPSVEIKADWIQLPSCSNPPQHVHIEQVGSTCYALAGMHLISKLLNQWIWATFEAQNLTTNPLRCRVLGCNDPYGSVPATNKGGPSGDTNLSPSLNSLMQAANLAPEWYYYRLDGAQTTFLDNIGNITLLGNSIIEADNAGVPLNQASCITCHAVSAIKSNGTDGITLLTSNPVGVPVALPDDTWIRRDFLWSMSIACPNAGLGRSCASTAGAKPK